MGSGLYILGNFKDSYSRVKTLHDKARWQGKLKYLIYYAFFIFLFTAPHKNIRRPAKTLSTTTMTTVTPSTGRSRGSTVLYDYDVHRYQRHS